MVKRKIGRIGSAKNDKKVAQKREKEIAKELGGFATPNSGAVDGFPGDVHLKNWLLEDKHTSSPRYILGIIELNKVTREAMRVGNRKPMMLFKFFKGIKIGTPSEIALVPEEYLQQYSFKRLKSKSEVTKKTVSVMVRFINEKYEEALSQDLIFTHTYNFKKLAKGVATSWTLIPKNDLKELGAFDD